MLDKIIAYAKQLFSLTRDQEQSKSDIKEIRQHDKTQDERIHQLAEAFQRLGFEFQHDRELSARDRELLLVKLDNAFLRAERASPLALPSGTDGIEELRQQIVQLQQEVELLRQRLAAVEKK